MTNDPSHQLFKNYLRHYREHGADRRAAPIDKIRELHLDRLPRWLDRVPQGAHILDAGCATGYLLGLLSESGYQQLTGVELSEQLVQIAKSSLPSRIDIVNSDIREFLAQVPDASFDVILFHHVLEHIPREHTISLLREFYRCIKPGGYLNIKVPNASFILSGHHLFGDFTHVTFLTSAPYHRHWRLQALARKKLSLFYIHQCYFGHLNILEKYSCGF